MTTEPTEFTVIFSHGKESGPNGFKIQRLRKIAEHFGCKTDSIDYRHTLDPDERVDCLRQQLPENGAKTLLVGSSMGGYVALVASVEFAAAGLFLMAPALYIPGWQIQDYPSKANLIEILHGWGDDVIPVDHSIRFARESCCNLHLIDGDHALNGVIETVENHFTAFLHRTVHPQDR